MKKKIYFILICVIAISIRVISFGSIPGGFNQDGLMAFVDAISLSRYRTDRYGMFMPVHLTAWGFGQMSSLLSYVMVPFIKLFGTSIAVARLPNLLFSILGLVFLYLFSKEAFGINKALVIFAFSAINPWHIMQSRWALDCNLFPHIIIAAIYFLYHGISKRKYFIYISMVIFGISMYAYGISIYIIPMLLLSLALFLIINNKITTRECLLCVSIYLLIAWPFITCMVINTFGLPTIETPFFTIPFFPDSMRSSDILFFSSSPLAQLLSNIKSLISIVFQYSSDLLSNQIKGFGTLYILSVPFFIFGLVNSLKKLKSNDGYSYVLIFFLIGIFNGLITNNVNINRSNILFYPMIIITATGIHDVCKKLKYMNIIVPVLYGFSFICFTINYFTYYANTIKYTFLYDFGQAVSSIEYSDEDIKYITADSQQKGFSHVSKILSLYYLNIDSKEYISSDFNDRYKFYIPPEIDKSEDAIYVVGEDDLDKFDDDFSITQYDRYYVVKKR